VSASIDEGNDIEGMVVVGGGEEGGKKSTTAAGQGVPGKEERSEARHRSSVWVVAAPRMSLVSFLEPARNVVATALSLADGLKCSMHVSIVL
jgi:hypothetical protein